MTCGENSMALVGSSVSAKLASSAELAILNSLTARNAWVKPLTDILRGHQNIANKGSRIACEETSPSFKLIVTNKQKALKMFSKISKNPSKYLKILLFTKNPVKL